MAEIIRAFLCSATDTQNATIDNPVDYLNGWLKKLKKDNKLVV